MRPDKTQIMMMEELEDAITQPQKFILLQKYGIVEPRLTRAEQILINPDLKNRRRNNGRKSYNRTRH